MPRGPQIGVDYHNRAEGGIVGAIERVHLRKQAKIQQEKIDEALEKEEKIARHKRRMARVALRQERQAEEDRIQALSKAPVETKSNEPVYLTVTKVDEEENSGRAPVFLNFQEREEAKISW
eukprot:CAMPEP_0175039986 /NCGR_PEP_ID=MMETSP0052_2-20121109/963_1 /TAXON_ID=51329 ORGANISM="Polytomella parva, Strain SAG 63-3" /NCGR_SAMPLE_ID=MMETSP0052_2 /ASSEMBLY_ACC=CAM_ASM_000194 /LENGTH=120 /DNA_ID=CAMNT_0016302049 /DNA_START=74 /DNA_END=433 /DNA_ORIENTATION=+